MFGTTIERVNDDRFLSYQITEFVIDRQLQCHFAFLNAGIAVRLNVIS